MNTSVRLVTLEPMRVAVFYGFGEQPEEEAWKKLEKWARDNKKWGDFARNEVYGFNNPDPTPASPNYGYELWMKLDEGDPAEKAPGLKSFAGGKYAVLRCPVPVEDYDEIGKKWKELVAWREQSSYRYGPHQWLEKSVNNTDPALAFVLDLYMPII